MMNRQDIVNKILNTTTLPSEIKDKSKTCFAPINIALIKYWGKRNEELKLPMSSSLSYSSSTLGTETELQLNDADEDFVILNDNNVANDDVFYKNAINFINLFRNALHFDKRLIIKTTNNIPTASGLASSASGFASLTLAINDFFDLNLNQKELSILARLGSGSACRSIVSAIDKTATFVLWNKGISEDGFDSYAEKITLPSLIEDNLSMFIVRITDNKKDISSTDAMRITIERSKKYSTWLKQTENDMLNIFNVKSFQEFGLIVENNSLLMHQAIRSAGIDYFLPKTYECIDFIKKLREQENLNVFCTIDAGANLKALCFKQELQNIKKQFNNIYKQIMHY